MKAKSKRLFARKKISLSRDKFISPIAVYTGLLAIGLVLYLPKLTSLVPYSQFEVPEALESADVDSIVQNMLFAPAKVGQFIILKLSDNDALIRLSSVAVMGVAVLLLYMMLRKWHTVRISVLTTLLFISSTYSLQIGRFVSHEGLYLWVVPSLLLACLWFISKNNTKKLPLATALVAISLYIPGSIVFLIVGILAFHKYIYKTWQRTSTMLRIACAALFTAMVAPLIYSFVLNPSSISYWFGVVINQSFSPKAIGNNFLTIPDSLFGRGPDMASQWVSGTPILDIFSISMLVLGIYAYRAGYYPTREKLIFGSGIICILLIGLGNLASIALIIPVIYILIANGLAYMLQSWFTVFPKNPVARPTGLIILSAVVLFACSYQLQRYFVVWPHTPEVRQELLVQR